MEVCNYLFLHWSLFPVQAVNKDTMLNQFYTHQSLTILPTTDTFAFFTCTGVTVNMLLETEKNITVLDFWQFSTKHKETFIIAHRRQLAYNSTVFATHSCVLSVVL